MRQTTERCTFRPTPVTPTRAALFDRRSQQLSEHREALRAIFQDGRFRRPESAMRRLSAWRERGEAMGIKALSKFNATLDNWMGRIANYFIRRSSNGRTEGFNRGLRAILWRACGMSNFQHFRLRVLHAFG